MNDDVLAMGDILLQMLEIAKESILEDKNSLEIILEKEKIIDNLETELTDRTTQLISREQPVASDLRNLIGIIKLLTHLQRIGEHSVHIVKSIIKDQSSTYRLDMKIFIPMLEQAIEMFELSMKAFKDKDSQLAESIYDKDLLLDDMHHTLLREMFVKINENPDYIDSGLNMIFLSRFIERIGDLVSNISEWIIFAVKGKH